MAREKDRHIHESSRKKARRLEKSTMRSAQYKAGTFVLRPGELASALTDRPGNEAVWISELLERDPGGSEILRSWIQLRFWCRPLGRAMVSEVFQYQRKPSTCISNQLKRNVSFLTAATCWAVNLDRLVTKVGFKPNPLWDQSSRLSPSTRSEDTRPINNARKVSASCLYSALPPLFTAVDHSILKQVREADHLCL